jgi:hypothetical protein
MDSALALDPGSARILAYASLALTHIGRPKDVLR